MGMRILVVGGTGLVGKRLCAALALAGHDLRAVSRNVPRSVPHLPPGTDLRPLPKTDDEWTSLVDGCNAIFNLAGEGLVEGRWSEDRKKSLRDSRVSLTDSLVRACGATVRRPRVLVNASAIGFYGPHGDEDLNESSAPGDDFLAEMCVAWEQAALAAKDVGLRVVTVRIGVVLSMDGGSLGKMLPPFRLGLGGPFGTGEQYFSWVHEDDLASGPTSAACSPLAEVQRSYNSSTIGLMVPSLVPSPMLRSHSCDSSSASRTHVTTVLPVHEDEMASGPTSKRGTSTVVSTWKEPLTYSELCSTTGKRMMGLLIARLGGASDGRPRSACTQVSCERYCEV